MENLRCQCNQTKEQKKKKKKKNSIPQPKDNEGKII